ncbi:MAG: hypothetical protein IJ368_08555, partial [Oscillospiraceae bacterium]|nr:hypothetical protein [Oscillospiraceae bacterium]
FCHPLVDGLIYAPCSPEEAKSNSPDICRMSDMLLMSVDGKEYLPFKIAEARKIAEENGSVYISNLLFKETFMALDWMIDGKHDTLIISEEHMKKEGKPYAPVTPLTNVVQPYKKFTNHFLYKKGTPEEPAVLADKDITGKLDANLEDTLADFPNLEIIGETEFEIFGTKISADKNEARCAALDKGLALADSLAESMKPHESAFAGAGVDFSIKSYIAKMLVKAAAKCGVTAEEKQFSAEGDALKDAFRKLISEKNSYGFKYSAPDKEKFAASLREAELSTADAEAVKKDIAALLRVRPAIPAVFNLARASSPADAETVESISEFWNSEALSPADLGKYLSDSYLKDCMDAEGKITCGGLKASLIAEDISTAAAKYKLKNAAVIDELKAYCDEYEKQSRTYNGTVFASVAEMEKAVKNEKELAESCADLSALNKEELEKLRKYIYDMKLDKKTTGRYLLKIKLALNDCELNQLKILCTGLTMKKTDELEALKNKLSGEGFDETLAAPFIGQIDDCILKAQLSELQEMFASIPDAAKADSLEKALSSGKYDKMFIRHFTSKLNTARDGFAKVELEKLCSGISSADKKALDDISAKITSVKCRDSLKTQYLNAISDRRNAIEEQEAATVFGSIKTADKAKLDELKKIIDSGKFRKVITDKYAAQIADRAVEIENAEFIAKCDKIPQMDSKALDEITAILESEKYPEEITKKYLPMVDERRKAIIKAELADICKDIPSMDFAKLDALEAKLKDEKYPAELTSGYFDTIKGRRKTLLNLEADNLCKNIGTMSKPELEKLSEMLKDPKFDPEYTKKYFAEIEKRFNKIETDKLDSMCKDIEKLKKADLEKLTNDIAALGFKKENTAPYLEKVRKLEINLMKSELENLCKNISNTPRKELSKLKEALSGGSFDKELTSKYIEQIDKRTAELIKQELSELCKNIANAPKDKLMSMKLKITETPEYAEAGKPYAEQIDSRLKAIDKAEFDKQMASIEKLNMEELENRKPALDVKLYDASLAKCTERGAFLERQELDKLCADVATADLKKLNEIKEKITDGDFTPEITFPYIKKVDEAISDRHVKYYSKLTENINTMSRAELIVLLEKINKNENNCPDDMLQRYIGKVNSKIREADSNILAAKCKNLSSVSEHQCFELIKDINEMDIDADTKKRFITQIELHITNLKTIDRDSYVEQLKNLMSINSITGVHFYVPGLSKSFESLYVKIQSAYASTEQYELPVLIHEVTMGHPEDSYLLTVNYLYFKGKSG